MPPTSSGAGSPQAMPTPDSGGSQGDARGIPARGRVRHGGLSGPSPQGLGGILAWRNGVPAPEGFRSSFRRLAQSLAAGLAVSAIDILVLNAGPVLAPLQH